MSQDSNTTGDTEPKPRLHSRKPDGSPPPTPEASPPAGASGNAGALPRLSFIPKKRAEEPAPAQPMVDHPVATTPPSPLAAEAKGSPLKRPPPGTRLIASNDLATLKEMPAPLTPIVGLTSSPFAPPKQAKVRGNLPLWIALLVLVVIVGGESTYILMQDQETVEETSQKPPVLVIGGAAAGKPIAITANGAAAPTPVYAYLQNLNPEIASGAEPRLFINSQMFHLGEVVAPEFGLKWIRIDDKSRELEFVDKQGQHYIMKF
jgi:hypothetical protein